MKSTHLSVTGLIVIGLAFGMAMPVHAIPILTPTALNPGDTYQLGV